MIPFDPTHLYPLLAEGSHTYTEAQDHSEQVDSWLGLRTAQVERTLEKPRHSGDEEQHWIGLPVRALLTPYTEIRAILERLNPRPGQTLVDLGAGYGRMGFVLAAHYPEVRFVGYEVVGPRVTEAVRCYRLHGIDPDRATVIEADLTDPALTLIAAEAYFLYDFGSRTAIEKTLADLRDLARRQPLCVVGRGRASRDAIERNHPWLSQVIPPEHHGHYSIYRSA